MIKVKASGGSAGESLQDYIIIKGDKGELKVPVNVQWEKSTEKPIMRAIETQSQLRTSRLFYRGALFVPRKSTGKRWSLQQGAKKVSLQSM